MGNKTKILLAAAVLFAAITVTAGQYAHSATVSPSKVKPEWQKGMCYITSNKDRYLSPESDASLKAVADTGATWVSILTTWYQEKCHTTSIFPTKDTPTDESIIHAIDTAHSLGMKVMLKPHLDIVDISSGTWRGEVACISEPEWKAWFKSYGDFMVHYARIAEEHKVEMLCIGTELSSASTIRENMWKDVVIKPVRGVYKGPLTYAANWNGEYDHINFWDALDYVGIDAYFPLSDKPKPTLDDIKKGWGEWVADIERFQKKVNMPIIFPEVGYCSAEGTAKTPWEEIAGGQIDMELQADCYKAILETFWDKDWFYGLYWWRWGTNVNFGGLNNRGFSMQNKPAQAVVTEWYHKPVPKR